MAVQIKLCGFRNIEDIIFASSLNIDYLGMIFVKDMPRTIDTKTAIRAVSICKDNDIKSVGVFLNQSKAKLTQPTGQKISKVRKQQKKISNLPILFLCQ